MKSIIKVLMGCVKSQSSQESWHVEARCHSCLGGNLNLILMSLPERSWLSGKEMCVLYVIVCDPHQRSEAYKVGRHSPYTL